MRKSSLKLKVMALTLGLLVVSNFLITFIALSIYGQDATTAAESQINLIMENTVDEINKFCDEQFALLDVIAGVNIFKSKSVSLEEKCAQLSSIVKNNPKYENISFYDATGFSYTTAGAKVDFSSKPYFQTAMKGKRWSAPPALNKITNTVLMFFSVPVYSDNNEIVGVMVAVVNGNPIEEIVGKINSEIHPLVYNLEDGYCVADINEKGDWKEQKGQTESLMKDVLAGKKMSTVYNDTSFSEKLIFNSLPLDPENPFGNSIPWTIVCIAKYDNYFGRITTLRWMILGAVGCFIVVSLLLAAFVVNRILGPLDVVKNSIDEIATGNADLTKRIIARTHDEISDVVVGFNHFSEKMQIIMTEVKASKDSLVEAGAELDVGTANTTESINEIIKNIDNTHFLIDAQNLSVEQTADAVSEISSNIDSLDRMIEKQSEIISRASSSVEEILGNVDSVNSYVSSMANSFEALFDSALNGIELQKKTSDRIGEIRNQSKTLQEANRAIESIAEETNLLAMNASIEAAHAGESGKGFAVVANEIRKLSETSSKQSKTIGEQLNAIVVSIEGMVQSSDQSAVAFKVVADKINETDAVVKKIKSVMESQVAGSRSIGDALGQMNNSSEEVRNASEEMTQGRQAILQEISSLKSSSSDLKNSVDEITMDASKISETSSELVSSIEKMRSSIDEIGNQVDQFRV